jgi:hypothetical protein
MLGTASPTTERRIPKDLNLQQQPCQNLKFRSFVNRGPTQDKFGVNISMPFTKYVLVFLSYYII